MNEGNAQRYWISLPVSTCRFIDIVDSCRTDISYSCDLKLCLDPIRPVNSSSIGPTWHPTHATILHLLLFGPPSLVRCSSRSSPSWVSFTHYPFHRTLTALPKRR
jgi:hypothetical protein